MPEPVTPLPWPPCASPAMLSAAEPTPGAVAGAVSAVQAYNAALATLRGWGWGAVIVDTPPPDWTCPACGQGKGRRRIWSHAGRHIYLFGPPRCTPCALAYYTDIRRNYEELLAPVSESL